MKYKEKLYHYTYKITNLCNGKIYLGVHSTNSMDDGYLGSGDVITLAKKKYGKENFKIEILEKFSSFEESRQAERELVNLEVVLDPNTYNLKIGGLGGRRIGYIASEKERAHLSKITKKRYEDPKERAKTSIALLKANSKPEVKQKKKEVFSTKEYKEKCSLSSLKSWSDKNIHLKQSLAIKEGKRSSIIWKEPLKSQLYSLWIDSKRPKYVMFRKFAIKNGLPDMNYNALVRHFSNECLI